MAKQKIPDIHLLINAVQQSWCPIDTLKNYLYQHPEEINRANKQKVTPTILACMLKNEKILNALLEYNPNLQFSDKQKCTPLHVAVCEYESCDNNDAKNTVRRMIISLIEKDSGALKCREQHGLTPRGLALTQGKNTPELADIFNKFDPPPKFAFSLFKPRETLTSCAKVVSYHLQP